MIGQLILKNDRIDQKFMFKYQLQHRKALANTWQLSSCNIMITCKILIFLLSESSSRPEIHQHILEGPLG